MNEREFISTLENLKNYCSSHNACTYCPLFSEDSERCLVCNYIPSLWDIEQIQQNMTVLTKPQKEISRDITIKGDGITINIKINKGDILTII